MGNWSLVYGKSRKKSKRVVEETNGQSEPGLGGWGQKGQWEPWALKRAPTPGKINIRRSVDTGTKVKESSVANAGPVLIGNILKQTFELAIEK